MSHMTYDHATAILERKLQHEAARRGERWTSGLARHLSNLHGNSYIDASDADRFANDYAYLATTLKSTR